MLYLSYEEYCCHLKKADELIKNNQNYLNYSQEDILSELKSNDINSYVKYFILARISMESKRLKNISDLINIIEDSDCNVRVCECIVFIAKLEMKFNVLKLLAKSNESNSHSKILTSILPHIKNEHHACLEQFYDIADAVEGISQDYKIKNFYREYAKLIVSSRSSAYVIGLLKSNINKSICTLLRYLAIEIYNHDISLTIDIANSFLENPQTDFYQYGIMIIDDSLCLGPQIFDAFFEKLEIFAQDTRKWLLVIPIYVKYVAKGNEKNIDRINKSLNSIINSDNAAKKAFIKAVSYDDKAMKYFKQILNEILISTKWDNPLEILEDVDYYLSKEINDGLALDILNIIKSVFTINGLKYSQNNFSCLHEVNSEFSKFNNQVVSFVVNSILYGSNNDFYFAIQVLRDIIQYNGNKVLISDIPRLNNKEIIMILQGVLYYIWDSHKIPNLLFSICSKINDLDSELEIIIKEIFDNYPFSLTQYLNKQEAGEIDFINEKIFEYLKKLSTKRISHQELAYAIPDLAHSEVRRKIYIECNSYINAQIMKKAKEKSIFPQLIGNEQIIKYGNSFGVYSQIGNGEKTCLSSQKFNTISHEAELPNKLCIGSSQILLKQQQYQINRNANRGSEDEINN